VLLAVVMLQHDWVRILNDVSTFRCHCTTLDDSRYCRSPLMSLVDTTTQSISRSVKPLSRFLVPLPTARACSVSFNAPGFLFNPWRQSAWRDERLAIGRWQSRSISLLSSGREELLLTSNTLFFVFLDVAVSFSEPHKLHRSCATQPSRLANVAATFCNARQGERCM
jgi:hypothetical protein